MGADLVITFHPAPTTTTGQPLITVTDAQRAEVERRIRAINPDPETIVSIIADHYCVDDEATADEVITEMVDAVCDYLSGWQNSRNSQWVIIKDDLYVITGGTTWGDDPSEHWTAACFVERHGIFDEPFPV